MGLQAFKLPTQYNSVCLKPFCICLRLRYVLERPASKHVERPGAWQLAAEGPMC